LYGLVQPDLVDVAVLPDERAGDRAVGVEAELIVVGRVVAVEVDPVLAEL
jgi:hypothetical protein